MKSSEVEAAVEAGAEQIFVEAEAKAKSWFGKARAWFSKSSWKTKMTAIVSVVILTTVAVGYMASGIERVTSRPVAAVAKAPTPTFADDVAKAQKDATDAKSAVADLTKTVTASQHQIDEVKQRVDAIDDSLTNMVAELRKAEEQIATLAAPKPKSTAKITTGSNRSKPKDPDWSDYRNWLP